MAQRLANWGAVQGRPLPAPQLLALDVRPADQYGELVGQEDDLIGVESIGSRPGYLDMEMFIELLDDERLVSRLHRAIEGRGAFRRFGDVLFEHDLLPDWLAFANERKQGRARAWLAVEGFTPDWPPW